MRRDGGSVSGSIGRRAFLQTAGAVTGVVVADLAPAKAEPSVSARSEAATQPAAPAAMLVLSDTEAAFLSAAVDCLIPADALSPAASEVGVVTFIDRKLASAWGGGAGLYRSGPFLRGTPEQGYQLPLTPRAYFTAGIAEVNDWSRKNFGQSFDQLASADRIVVLTRLESSEAKLDDFSARAFFEALLQITMEGFFADPVYGGNRAMAGWRVLGFPGLPAFYGGTIATSAGKRYQAPPKSIADFL